MSRLTEQQIQELKKRLEQQASELREEIRQELIQSDNEQYIDLAGRVHDEGDESIANLLSDWNITNVDRQITALRGVEAALSRISMGGYGICQECDNNIDFERLKAQPAADRCFACQQEDERRKGTKNPSL